MSLRGLEYAIAEAFAAIKRNFLMSVASIMTSAITLSILGCVVLMALGLSNGTYNILDQFEIRVFVDKGTSNRSVEKIASSIEKIPHVKSVTLISAQSAWKEMKANLKDKIPLDGIVSNPLPDSFRVKLDDQTQTIKVASEIQALSHIDEVVQSQEYAKAILHISYIIKIIGIIAVVMLFLVSSFIISNTIRLTVYARRREIRIMQLVGATNWFIRFPLLIEGTTLGIIGGGIACLLVYAGSYYTSEWVMKIMPILGQLSSNADPKIFYSCLVGFGWVIGAAGTMVSIQRFLKHNIN